MGNKYLKKLNNMDINFSKQLIKGKIAELIFDQMFRSNSRYTIIPFGYESLMPELTQISRKNKKESTKKVIKTISNSPDFVLIDKEGKQGIYLVEVKYRGYKKINEKEVKQLAENQIKRWDPSHIFLATQEGFYFDSCGEIIKNGGKIKNLDWIDKKIQNIFLKLLCTFERK